MHCTDSAAMVTEPFEKLDNSTVPNITFNLQVPVTEEADVFEALGLAYRPPEQRELDDNLMRYVQAVKKPGGPALKRQKSERLCSWSGFVWIWRSFQENLRKPSGCSKGTAGWSHI